MQVVNPKLDSLPKVCECGSKKDKCAEICRRCRTTKNLYRRGLVTLEESKQKRGPFIYVVARNHAKSVMKHCGIERKCAVCDYDIYVEVCHLKAISSFDPSATLNQINRLANLAYLCPNHHKEFDRGLMSCENVSKLYGARWGNGHPEWLITIRSKFDS